MVQIAFTQSYLDENRTMILNKRSLVMSTSDIPRPYWRPHYLPVSSAYNIGLAKKFLRTFWQDVAAKPNGHFCQPGVFPLRRVCGKSPTLLPSYFSTQKKGIWQIEIRLNETTILVVHEYWLDHAFMFSLEWLSANYHVVNLSQEKIKLQDSNL